MNSLQFNNRIWCENLYLITWKEAIIIPVPKERKYIKKPINYRPIASTCTDKLLKKWLA